MPGLKTGVENGLFWSEIWSGFGEPGPPPPGGGLKHPKKTLSEIAHDVYTETGSDFALARIFNYLKRNRLSLKKVRLNFSGLQSIFQ